MSEQDQTDLTKVRRSILRTFTYGLYAVGVQHESGKNAFTANWLTQVSFDPPLVAISVENDGRSIGLLRASGVFAISVYRSGQREQAGTLGRRSASMPDKLDNVAHSPAPVTGCPVLDESLGYVECRVLNEAPAGDSTLFVAEILNAVMLAEGEALTMHETGFKHSG